MATHQEHARLWCGGRLAPTAVHVHMESEQTTIPWGTMMWHQKCHLLHRRQLVANQESTICKESLSNDHSAGKNRRSESTEHKELAYPSFPYPTIPNGRSRNTSHFGDHKCPKIGGGLPTRKLGKGHRWPSLWH